MRRFGDVSSAIRDGGYEAYKILELEVLAGDIISRDSRADAVSSSIFRLPDALIILIQR